MRATAWSLGSRASRDLAVRALVTVALLGGLAALLLLAPPYRFEWGRVWGTGAYGGYILRGLLATVVISAAAMVLGLLFGFAGGFARLSRRPAVQQVATVYVQLVRGTPLLVQLLIAYYCIGPAVSSALGRLGAPAWARAPFENSYAIGVVALGFFEGAYLTEIVRSAIQSIDRGQTEAAVAQGMTKAQVMRFILLPQALRRMIPPMTGELVSLVKESSLLSAVLVSEVTKRSIEASSSSYKTFEVYVPLALLYLSITFPLAMLARWFERRLA